MYTGGVSVGLDDCLLPTEVASSARSIVADRVARYRRAAAEAIDGAQRRLPYRLDGEDRPEAEISRLVALRSESEALVVRHVLGERRRGAMGTPGSAGRLNQIALLCMLGTKGSVSNLMQCTHALGRRVHHPPGVSPSPGGGLPAVSGWWLVGWLVVVAPQQIIQNARLPVSDYHHPAAGC